MRENGAVHGTAYTVEYLIKQLYNHFKILIAMKTNEEKLSYESPQTRKTMVNLESGICASSTVIQNPDTNNGRIEEHEKNTDFDMGFGGQEWDEIE